MNAISIEIRDFGPAESLSFKEVTMAESLGDHDVLIDVHFSGINFADIVMRLGMYLDAPPRPFVPGYEVSGVVRKVGAKVVGIRPLDKVIAGTRFGGYSSQVIVPEWQVLPLPENMTFEEGAATPVNFITAHIALNEFARIRSGDRVLIDCATGGVGVFCLQMCKDINAQTVGLTSNPAKKSFIESYGAKAMTHEEFWASGEKNFYFILNSTGGKDLKRLYERLDKSGLLLCIGLQQAIDNGKSSLYAKLKALLQTPWYPMLKLMMSSRSAGGFNALKFFDDEDWIKKILAEMKKNDFKPYVDKVFPYTQVAEAHKYLEGRKAKGKVLISWKE